MRKRCFSEVQTGSILREAKQSPLTETSTPHGLSEQTIYDWHKHFGAMRPTRCTALGNWSRRTRG